MPTEKESNVNLFDKLDLIERLEIAAKSVKSLLNYQGFTLFCFEIRKLRFIYCV